MLVKDIGNNLSDLLPPPKYSRWDVFYKRNMNSDRLLELISNVLGDENIVTELANLFFGAHFMEPRYLPN